MNKSSDGDSTAQFRLGWRYVADKKPRLALACFKRLAKQGDVPAMTALGLLLASAHENGEGVSKDPKQMVHWYRQAALLGDAEGQRELGICYHEGHDVKRNFTTSVHWYRAAAKQHDAWAQYCLGMSYRDGEGVRKNRRVAQKWFQLAAANRLPEAWQAIEEVTISLLPVPMP